MPAYMSRQAAGMDLCAACESTVTIASGDIKLIPCGFYMALPGGYEAQVRPRSGLAVKHGIILPNAPGTIDADYRGEVCVILGNIGREAFVVRRGMRVAQMVVAPVRRAEMRKSWLAFDTFMAWMARMFSPSFKSSIWEVTSIS